MIEMRRLVCLGACGVTLAVALAASLGFGADPEIAWREKMRVVVTTNGLATVGDTNVTTTATAHTPAFAGQLLFGENRVQEAKAKFPGLRALFPDLRLHLIGHLQTNKAEEAVAIFDLVETVDRLKLADALAKAMAKLGRRIPVYIQVNTGEESQKGGMAPPEAEALLAECRRLGLEVRGLMCIPPADEEPAPHFALLADMARRFGLAELSMGMSADFEAAIRLGATHVRVGTAIFGSRPAPPADA